MFRLLSYINIFSCKSALDSIPETGASSEEEITEQSQELSDHPTKDEL